ncbi:hypothetical protein [Peribacillus loiseleuriae]|uniref:hypothetical protein n=1 Tax=Peribacillus loiseleuriae TaxID=1679170 RepID=UPI003CFE15CF
MNYYAVLDVGGSSIKYALMDETGCFIEKSSLPTPKKSLTKFMDTVDSNGEASSGFGLFESANVFWIPPVEGRRNRVKAYPHRHYFTRN